MLTNYFQLAAKSITSTNSGVQLKVNWFALNIDAHKYDNTNFYNSRWQRSGEFVGFYSAKSWQAGLNYNVLSRRDTTLHLYTDAYAVYDAVEFKIENAAQHAFEPPVDVTVQQKMAVLATGLYQAGTTVTDLKAKINVAIPGLLQGLPSDAGYINGIQDALNTAITNNTAPRVLLPANTLRVINADASILAGEAVITLITIHRQAGTGTNPFNNFISAQQVTALNQFLDNAVANDPILHDRLNANTLADVNQAINTRYKELVQFVGRQPLLTFGYLYTMGKGTTLSSHEGGLTYLQGFGAPGAHTLGQFNASLTDTLTSSDPSGINRYLNRNIIALQAGYNQVLLYASNMSLAELNIALEADRVTQGYVANTDKSKFYFDAYLRVRLPSTPWVKLNLKYDPKNSNVFGLLDFTYNLDK